ncbi:MAG TPA: alpha/beta fold hydrolase [Hyphomicrobiaceae bacterium]|nr:alpha/beta fold hydrolase [Hyphomicrobiaceae bacterium]
MPMPAFPTIVVPGITGTYLQDDYPLPAETVWSVLRRDYERIALHPDNTRLEALEPARVIPGQAFEVAYKELINELRHNLSLREDQPVPVFAFGYDWRQPIEVAEAQLGQFIEEVIERTKLLRHYDRENYAADPKVNLVGHSMGGLVIAGYLHRTGPSHKVHKVVTLATPFQGSFEAVIKIATGTANLGQSEPSSREREAARLTPALYQLLPSFEDGLEVEEGLPRSLFDPGIWQPSIVETIKEYIRLHGLDRTDRDRRARELFAGLLNAAQTHRTRIDKLNLASLNMEPARWLCVVGVDSNTRVKLKVVKRGRVADFEFRSEHRQNKWGDPDPATGRLTGDGTVPFEGAVPTFLPLQSLVCVKSSDFGYWEVQDRLFSEIAGFHGIMPNMDMLHRLIVTHLTGRPARHANIWGRPAPGVSDWDPPIPNLETKP